MLFAMFNYQGGIANFVGLTLFQPLFASLLSVLTVIICGLVGLPIRLNKKLNNWWRNHFYVSILLGLIGSLACATSLLPSFVEEATYGIDGMDVTQTVPNQILAFSGWLLLGIGTLHTYLPNGIQDKIENLVNHHTNGLTRKME